MRIIEIINEDTSIKKMPHLYLDMDGVQADFFGAWSKKLNVNHWKAIVDREKEIEQLANSSHEEVYNFFKNLAPLSGGAKVIKWLRKNKIPFTVLSAPLRGPYSDASIEAKKDWLNQHNPGTSDNAIFTSEKYKYATKNGQPNVLVDDFGKYLKAWSDAGGIAVKHEDEYEDRNSGYKTISMLEKIYKPFMK